DRKLLDEGLSSAANIASDSDGDEWLDGGIWERSIGTLGDLKQRILELLSKAVNKETIDQMRPYRKKNNWLTSDALDGGSELSAELSGVLSELSLLLSSLSRVLPYSAFVRISRGLGEELDTFLVERVACAHKFNIQAGMQFCRDIDALSRIMSSSAAPAAFKAPSQRYLPKARECGKILSCVVDSTASQPACADSGFGSGSGSKISLSLEEWGPTVMNTAADERETALVLNKLGIKHISVKQVRQLVNNRSDFAQSTPPSSE
ncbi:hypothetical protein LPJ75_001936, partial [Coemansia sp. RSA 2598]